MSARKESKNGKIKGCGTTFTRLNGCGGGAEEGVWVLWRGEI